MATETKAKVNDTTKTSTAQSNAASQPTALKATATPPNTGPPASTDGNDQDKRIWQRQEKSKVHHTNAAVAPGSGHVGKPTTQDGTTSAKRGGFGHGGGRGFVRGHCQPRE